MQEVLLCLQGAVSYALGYDGEGVGMAYGINNRLG